MLKKIVFALSAVLLITVVASGCSPDNDKSIEESTNIEAATEAEVSETDDDKDHTSDEDTVYEPEDHKLLIPFVGSYKEDGMRPKNNQYLIGLVDLDGNQVYEPVFDSVYEADGYYVVSSTENGVRKYGIISDDGTVFTGLEYDGAAAAEDNYDGVYFYGTDYYDGRLKVTSLNSKLEVIGEDTIVIDEEALELDRERSLLSVCMLNDGRAFLNISDPVFTNGFLIDTSDGKVLYKSGTLVNDRCILFGNVIIEQNMNGREIKVYDLDGNAVFDEKDAYSGKVNDERYMIAFDGKLIIYDKEWKIISSMDIDKDAVVMTSFERIAVNSDMKTKLYDKDLNLINEIDNFILGNGTYLRDWYGYGEGDMYFDAISGSNDICDLNTGKILPKEYGFFYSFKYGYIFADNKSNGNDPEKKWSVYDGDLEPVLSGEGMAELIHDKQTGMTYIRIINEDKMSVYSLAEGRSLFELNDAIYNLKVINGRFFGWNTEKFYMLDESGNVIFSYDIDYKSVSYEVKDHI